MFPVQLLPDLGGAVDPTVLSISTASRFARVDPDCAKMLNTVEFCLSPNTWHRGGEGILSEGTDSIIEASPPLGVVLPLSSHDSHPLQSPDGSHQPSHSALRRMGMNGEFNFRGRNPVKIRCCQYLNNVREQDHRRVKGRLEPMLGFKTFYNARRVITGIELAQKIHKGQFAIPITLQ